MADDYKTFQLRYVGTRFDGARLPVDVLSDLPAFRDLLVAYAKDEWRASNVDRQRLPRGFDKSISFDLIGLKSGSAVPTLAWNRQTAQANLPGFSDVLEGLVNRSYVSFIKLIDNVGRDIFPIVLSSEQIRALNKLGSALKEGERIEFIGAVGENDNVVYLDSSRRKKLITHARDTYQARFEGVGRLLGSHVAGHIDVYTNEFGEIRIPLDADRIVDEFDGNINSEIQFAIQIELDNTDKYKGIVEVFDVELTVDADVMRGRSRLEELKRLTEGWHDGSGAAIDPLAIGSATRFLNKTPTMARTYCIYPTNSGGVLFEFESKGWDLSVEFGPGDKVEMYGVEMDGSEELEPHVFDRFGDDFINFFNDKTER